MSDAARPEQQCVGEEVNQAPRPAHSSAGQPLARRLPRVWMNLVRPLLGKHWTCRQTSQLLVRLFFSIGPE